MTVFGYPLFVTVARLPHQGTIYEHLCRTGRGGPRVGAGRKPSKRPIVHHIRRVRFSRLTAALVTVRVRADVPSLRRPAFPEEMRRSFT